MPVCDQAGFDRVIQNVVHNAMPFGFVANYMIVPLVMPELACSSKQHISSFGGIGLERVHSFRQWAINAILLQQRLEYDMTMVRHDAVGIEVVVLSVQEV